MASNSDQIKPSTLHKHHPMSSEPSKTSIGRRDDSGKAKKERRADTPPNPLVSALEKMAMTEKYTKYVFIPQVVYRDIRYDTRGAFVLPATDFCITYISAPPVLKPYVNAARGVARMSSPWISMHDIFWSGIEKWYLDRSEMRARHTILRDRYICLRSHKRKDDSDCFILGRRQSLKR